MSAESQEALARWIWAQPGAEPPAGLRAVGARTLAQGLAAYREHAKALAVRALASHCPRLAAWLGEAEFAGLAWAFARAHPPRLGDMNRWGGELPSWLAALPGMEAEPPAVAALDLGLHELLAAADEAEPDAQLWTLLQTEPGTRLRLRIAGRPLALPATLQAHLTDDEGLDWPSPPGSQVWAWRRGWRPCWAWLADDLSCLLNELQQAPHLAAAVERTLALWPALDLGLALQLAWRQGWLQGADRL